MARRCDSGQNAAAGPLPVTRGDMEHMRRVAFETAAARRGLRLAGDFLHHDRIVVRACGEAFQAGGFLTMLMTGILVIKAFEARTKHYRRTEMWLYLPKDLRPPASYAQWASAPPPPARNLSYTFARWTAAVSIAMWAIALMLLRHWTLVETRRSQPGSRPLLQRPTDSRT